MVEADPHCRNSQQLQQLLRAYKNSHLTLPNCWKPWRLPDGEVVLSVRNRLPARGGLARWKPRTEDTFSRPALREEIQQSLPRPVGLLEASALTKINMSAKLFTSRQPAGINRFQKENSETADRILDGAVGLGFSWTLF